MILKCTIPLSSVNKGRKGRFAMRHLWQLAVVTGVTQYRNWSIETTYSTDLVLHPNEFLP